MQFFLKNGHRDTLICLASAYSSLALSPLWCRIAFSIVRKKGSLAWAENEVPFKGVDTGNISPVYFCRGKRTTERKREICSPDKKMRIRCVFRDSYVYIYIYILRVKGTKTSRYWFFSFFFLNGIPENDKWIFVINPFLTPLTLLKSKRRKIKRDFLDARE